MAEQTNTGGTNTGGTNSTSNSMEIKLYWQSLKSEIDAETWKAGKCYITSDKAEERAEAQTGDDPLDVNYCYRKIEQGIMQLQDIAHKFFTEFKRTNTSTSSSDNSSTSTGNTNKLSNQVDYWTISLKFGSRQNVDGTLLANELHKYVVLNVLQEWCKIANPSLINEYVSRQNAEEIRIKSIMYRKEEPTWTD